MASLEVGFSHDIFVDWAADSKNLVLFTERGQVCSAPWDNYLKLDVKRKLKTNSADLLKSIVICILIYLAIFILSTTF